LNMEVSVVEDGGGAMATSRHECLLGSQTWKKHKKIFEKN